MRQVSGVFPAELHDKYPGGAPHWGMRQALAPQLECRGCPREVNGD